MQRPETLESSRSGQMSMRKGLLGDVDATLFGWAEPFGHDVGVGEGGIGHWRHEKQGNGAQAVQVHLAGKAFEQVVGDA